MLAQHVHGNHSRAAGRVCSRIHAELAAPLGAFACMRGNASVLASDNGAVLRARVVRLLHERLKLFVGELERRALAHARLVVDDRERDGAVAQRAWDPEQHRQLERARTPEGANERCDGDGAEALAEIVEDGKGGKRNPCASKRKR
eukprot:4619389-Pleurochrysis_carterae.AAC.2